MICNFALLDSEIRIHVEEFRHFYEKLAADATVVFHDTGAQHEGSVNAIRELIAQGQLTSTFFPTPRGIFVGSVRRPPELPATAPPEALLKIKDLSIRSLPCGRAAILVLGVHRSGTSSLAHLLNVLGAKLPEKVMGPAPKWRTSCDRVIVTIDTQMTQLLCSRLSDDPNMASRSTSP